MFESAVAFVAKAVPKRGPAKLWVKELALLTLLTTTRCLVAMPNEFLALFGMIVLASITLDSMLALSKFVEFTDDIFLFILYISQVFFI